MSRLKCMQTAHLNSKAMCMQRQPRERKMAILMRQPVSNQSSQDASIAKDCMSEHISPMLLADEDRNCCHLPPGSGCRLWELEESFHLQGNEMMGAPIFQHKLKGKAGRRMYHQQAPRTISELNYQPTCTGLLQD